jgi:type IV pilus assembly protein PilM
VDRYSAADARPVLDGVSAEMAGEIQKTFDFFQATTSEGSVDEIVLGGGGALTPNLAQILRERFGVPVEVLDPFRRVHVRESEFDAVDAAWLRSVAPMLTIAVGLAIRKVGG